MSVPPVRLAAHAYPWDVVGDDAFADRVHAHGVAEVTLAAAYHSVRAATPLHPSHRVVTARSAALYRPLRRQVWAGRRLVPAVADWVGGDDPFAEASGVLKSAGLAVNAWIVLTHATRLGESHPELAVVNCFGDGYPYALCPSLAEVRSYAATLAAEAVRDVPIDGVSLEAWGQLGVTHGGHHEKTDGAWGPAAERLLSVCCCHACRRAWEAAGVAPDAVVDELRRAVIALGADDQASIGADLADVILRCRHEAADALLAEVLSEVRQVAPGSRVTLHGSVDPWATGPAPALTSAATRAADAVLIPAWPTTEGPVEDARRIRAALPEDKAVAAYVTVLPPVRPERVLPHARALRDVGVTEFHVYHLGLAAGARRGLITQLAEFARGLDGHAGLPPAAAGLQSPPEMS
ncbi:hypothetical protein GCM10029978_061170 [Actinoallomurus acanthiterrae]